MKISDKRIIFNDDGGDAAVLNSFKNLSLSKEERIEKFLQTYLKNILGTKVTTIFYCTGTVGLVIHTSKVASVLLHANTTTWTNKTEQQNINLKERIDPLKVAIEFCRKNKLEIFWSLRMNDIHDSGDDEGEKFIFKMNRFKQKHPKCLLGSNPWPTFGRPTSCDYSKKEVRDLVYEMVKEVCENYDIDGIHLDFCRHAIFFREPAFGMHATKEQLDMMTQLIAMIKKMLKEKENERKHPILLAIRIPDSVKYCKVIGLDLETWLKNKLVDILIVGGYVQFNWWKDAVEFSHKYKTNICIDLSNPAGGERVSIESYRARAYTAWVSGADGIHLFNFFNFDKPYIDLLNEISEPKLLATRDKMYFPRVMETRMGWAGFPVVGYMSIPKLGPAEPKEIRITRNDIVPFFIADNLEKEKIKPSVTLKIMIDDFQGIIKKLKKNFVIFYINDRKLENPEIKNSNPNNITYLEYNISWDCLRYGFNEFEIINRGENLIKVYDLQVFLNYPEK